MEENNRKISLALYIRLEFSSYFVVSYLSVSCREYITLVGEESAGALSFQSLLDR